MPNGGGAAVQVTRQGGFAALESPDGRFLYYTKTDDGGDGLWRMSVSGGPETRIIHDAIATRAFFVTADSIYFIKAVAGNGPYFVSRTVSDPIEIYSLRTGQTRTLARIANPWLYLSVAPDRGSLLYSETQQGDNELRLVEHFQ